MVRNFCDRKVGINYTQLFIFTKGNTGSIKKLGGQVDGVWNQKFLMYTLCINCFNFGII